MTLSALRLGLLRSSFAGAFVAGAALVHCGTATFSVSPDGGSPDATGGSGSSSGSGSATGSGTGTGTSSGSGSASGTGSGTGAQACVLSSDCTTPGDECCVDVANAKAYCKSGGSCVHTCESVADCPGASSICCTTTGFSKHAGICELPSLCPPGSGSGSASGSGTGSASGTGSGSASGSGCTPKVCGAGVCGSGPNGCGGTLVCGDCPQPESCVLPGGNTSFGSCCTLDVCSNHSVGAIVATGCQTFPETCGPALSCKCAGLLGTPCTICPGSGSGSAMPGH